MKPTSKLSSILCLDFHSTIVAPLEGLAPEIMEGLYLSDTKEYFVFAPFYATHARGLQEKLIGLLCKSLFCSLGSSAFTHSLQKYIYEIGRWAYYNHAFIYPCSGKIVTDSPPLPSTLYHFLLELWNPEFETGYQQTYLWFPLHHNFTP